MFGVFRGSVACATDDVPIKKQAYDDNDVYFYFLPSILEGPVQRRCVDTLSKAALRHGGGCSLVMCSRQSSALWQFPPQSLS